MHASFMVLVLKLTVLVQARAMGGLDVLVNSGKFACHYIINLQLQQSHNVAAYNINNMKCSASSENIVVCSGVCTMRQVP